MNKDSKCESIVQELLKKHVNPDDIKLIKQSLNLMDEDLTEVQEDIAHVETILHLFKRRHLGYIAERACMALIITYNEAIDFDDNVVREYIVKCCETIIAGHNLDKKVSYSHRDD